MLALKVFSIFMFLLCSDARKSYSGYKVLSVPAGKILKDITEKYELDVWKESQVGDNHILVTPETEDLVLQDLRENGINWSIHIEDVQDLVDAEHSAIINRRHLHGKKAFDYNNFNEFQEFEPELRRLASNCPEGFQCEVYSIGQSFEGNEMNVLHISVPGAGKRAYWIDALIHAREWLAGATHMNIARKLVEEYGTDAEATRLLDGYDWYFLPVMNPDGYIYTWTDERLWRKNRRQNEDSACFGTDLNRNYDYEWGGVGASTNPCSDTYRGDTAASEPVTRNTQTEMDRIGASINAWVTLHTYSEYWLTPWAFTEGGSSDPCALPPDYDDQLSVAEAVATAIENTHGTSWEAGNWCDVLYASSGVLQDHAKGAAGIKYAFTPELRGNSFIVDPSEIQPSSEEIWNGIVAMVDAIEVTEKTT